MLIIDDCVQLGCRSALSAKGYGTIVSSKRTDALRLE